MAKGDIIAKLESAQLSGRGGAAFPTAVKWQAVKNQLAEKKYIVANGSEGEPNVLKDGYILAHYPAELISGIKIALQYIDHATAIIFLRKDYYRKYKAKLEKLIGRAPIKLFREKGGYLSGEETVLCQEIEHHLARPRIKPPYPGQAGIFGCPTLINNIETFYFVSQIAKNKYQHSRFYTISGDVKKPGVYELPDSWSIQRILQHTGNLPKTDYFLQIGGGASGEILLPSETKKKVGGSGAIVIFDRAKTDLYQLMKFWVTFFMRENCDKCTPCREGTYRLEKMLENKKLDAKKIEDLMFVLENTSFCALGKSVVVPFRSLLAKIKISPRG
ncbi:MAG: hypothetical protein C3F02_02250 [Parcubacteria group bacterium]|nr:MAG: hypothetical protein C3F02_02250 [Parcubacteria group bacterium]